MNIEHDEILVKDGFGNYAVLVEKTYEDGRTVYVMDRNHTIRRIQTKVTERVKDDNRL